MTMIATRAWAPLPTLIVSWAVLAHVLSFRGLVIWVVAGSLLTWLATAALLSAGRVGLGLAAGAGLTLLIAWLAESLGGTTSGPITRATLLCAGLAVAATVLALGPAPRLALTAMLALLGATLGLGASGAALAWTGAWVVAAGAMLVIIGPYQAADLRTRTRLLTMLALLVTSAVSAVFVALTVATALTQPWTIPGHALATLPDTGPLPPAPGPPVELTGPLPPAPTLEQRVPAVPESAVIAQVLNWLVIILAATLLIALLALLILLAYRTIMAMRWALLHRRLRNGTPEQRTIGAWTWVRMNRARAGDPLPAWVTPDTAAAWANQVGDTQVAAVARVVTEVAFNPDPNISSEGADLAWQRAEAAVASTQRGTRRSNKKRSLIAPPRVVRRVRG